MNPRRKLLLVLSASALLPRWAAAQRSTVFRVGWISLDRPGDSSFLDHFRTGLRDLGYVEGRSLMIDAHWGEGSRERLGQLAAELVRSNPHVIVTQGGPATYPVVRAGATIPVVFGFSGDPVEGKLVESFARPGRNLTGVSFLSLELVGKRIELLREAVPGLKRIAIIARPEHPGEQGELRASQTAAKAIGVTLDYFPIKSEAELEKALAAIPQVRCEAMVAFPDATMMRYSERIAAIAIRNRIPASLATSQTMS
jgi:putative ABC transport system substrate-binding protein